MSPAEFLLPTYDHFLSTLAGLVEKAKTHPKGDSLLSARLAEDMLPLSTQIRFLCNMPGEHLRTLAGIEFVSSDADDATLADAATRISKAREWVTNFDVTQIKPTDASAGFTLPNGMAFDLTAGQYIRDWALSQFYFHIMAAYMILRSEGLEIGKADYVPYMLQYLRVPQPA
ncbi:DUF1993 family protein [Altererythrobacter sp. Z27]|uniref:DUF1993 family protein n=1 Tax=Altererythrobacter sp. Z27 TaxID=3461147 RepID=UPI004044C02A